MADALEELLGICRQRLDVAALALGVERVEGERRLARTGYTRNHGDASARNLDVDILEVVLASAANHDFVVHNAPRRQARNRFCLLYTSPSPRDRQKSRMPSS